MLSYQRAQPLAKDLCARHGVPYVQEHIFHRPKKTRDIMTGATSMQWFPAEDESQFLAQDAAGAVQMEPRRTQLLSDRCMDAAR